MDFVELHQSVILLFPIDLNIRLPMKCVITIRFILCHIVLELGLNSNSTITCLILLFILYLITKTIIPKYIGKLFK